MNAGSWRGRLCRHGAGTLMVCLLVVVGSSVASVVLASSPDNRVSFNAEQVVEQARALAAQPFQPVPDALPEVLRSLDYDGYRAIRFRPDQAVWRDAGQFQLQFFHPGFLFTEPVDIALVDGGVAHPLPFDRTRFRYDPPVTDLAPALDAADVEVPGWAGFRVHYPLHAPSRADEFLVFLGASYFRVIGRNQGYGISARGLAIDTVRPQGEEFPAFRAFWIERPATDATTLVIHALLDSPSVTGAYRFTVTPGASTVVDVDAVVFARESVERLGIAPLTSMFTHGDTSVGGADDHRPRVHDSDGLLVRASHGEWTWRPLSNPRQLREFGFIDRSASGFGLLQRERAFDRYLDAEARYERRPGKWVEPLDGDWGSGRVVLVEIPTESEIHDNIVAFWESDAPLQAGEVRRFRYRLTTVGAWQPAPALAQVVRTRQGHGATPGTDAPPPDSLRHFSVVFRGGEAASLAADNPPDVQLESRHGSIDAVRTDRLANADWLVSFLLSPEPGQVADLRLWLTSDGRTVSETWSFAWDADALHGR